jgi:lysophospholipase L1-like esterase
VPPARHSAPRWADRLRAVGHGVVVALLSLPTVAGVAALATAHPGMPTTPAAPVAAEQPLPKALPTTAPPSTAAPATTITSTPSPVPGTSAGPGRAVRSVARNVQSAAAAALVAAADVQRSTVSHVVGLGDSVPAGTNCGCTDYVDLLAQDLGSKQGLPVTATNLATPGLTTQGLLDQLASPEVRQALSTADVVVVTIGANDVEGTADPSDCALPAGQDADSAAAACYGDQLTELGPNLDRIAAQIAALPTAPGARVLLTGYWNVFLDGSVAQAKGGTYVAVADAVTRAVNQRIAAAASAHGSTYVDLMTPFHGSNGTGDCTALLASDGDHPNAAGHALIEQTLAAAL